MILAVIAISQDLLPRSIKVEFFSIDSQSISMYIYEAKKNVNLPSDAAISKAYASSNSFVIL